MFALDPNNSIIKRLGCKSMCTIQRYFYTHYSNGIVLKRKASKRLIHDLIDTANFEIKNKHDILKKVLMCSGYNDD